MNEGMNEGGKEEENWLPMLLTLCLSPKAGKLAMERGWAINVGECPAGLACWVLGLGGPGGS